MRAMSAPLSVPGALSSASKPPFCRLWFGVVPRRNFATVPANVATPLLIPKHNLRWPCTAGEMVSEFFRKLRFASFECLFCLLDLLLQILGLCVLREFVANAFEEVEGRFACGEIVSPFPDSHGTSH